jgi:hypothetical protein
MSPVLIFKISSCVASVCGLQNNVLCFDVILLFDIIFIIVSAFCYNRVPPCCYMHATCFDLTVMKMLQTVW